MNIVVLRWLPIGLAVLAVSLCAQENMPRGLVRGRLVSFDKSSGDKSAGAGVLVVQSDAGVNYDCQYDTHTYFERDHWPIRVAKLAAGDPVEILSDSKLGSATCYARIVRVIDPPARLSAVARQRSAPPPAHSFLTFFPARGTLTYSGMVIRRTDRAVTLRTRSGERTLLLRSDTRCVEDGVTADLAALAVNQHVFVRAGRNLDGAEEAYQVMWGQILDAR